MASVRLLYFPVIILSLMLQVFSPFLVTVFKLNWDKLFQSWQVSPVSSTLDKKQDSCSRIFSSWYNFKVRDSSQKALQYSFCICFPSSPSYLFFHWFCVRIYFSLCVFIYIYSYSIVFTLCIVWMKNKTNKQTII